LSCKFVVALVVVFNDVVANIGVACVVDNGDGTVVVANANAAFPC
jgi:hypothetical protein